MESFDWSRFVLRIPISASKENLYRAWTTKNGIEHWFLKKAEFTGNNGLLGGDDAIQEGNTYTWWWHGWPDVVHESGTILKANGTDFISFKFGEAGICDVHLKNELGLVVVELTQYDIPDDEKGRQYFHLGCKSGWTFHLTNMKSIFEGGADLRNKDVNMKDVINA